MLIVYLSLSGNIRKFVRQIGMKSIELSYANPLTEVNEDYVIIMPSYDDEITDTVSEFIDYKNNVSHLKGVVGSGNKNFGKEGYCFNARQISEKYNSPLLFKFEFSGTEDDVVKFKKEVQQTFEVTGFTKES
jgi:protein involved in ribonucleotide reduction